MLWGVKVVYFVVVKRFMDCLIFYWEMGGVFIVGKSFDFIEVCFLV